MITASSALGTISLSCSLLREAEPISIDSNRDTTDISASTSNKAGMGFVGSTSAGSGAGGIGSTFGHCDPTSLEERQLLGRYGVWLLVGLCTPNEDTPVEILGRLLSMLFHWFHITAYCFDGIEKRLIHLIFSVGNLTLCIYTLYSSRRREPDVGSSVVCRLNMLQYVQDVSILCIHTVNICDMYVVSLHICLQRNMLIYEFICFRN